MTVLIKTINLSKVYSSGFRAINNISIQVKSGEIFGLLGPNDAGKTTLIKILKGTLQPTSGTFYVNGIKHEPSNPDVLANTIICHDATMHDNHISRNNSTSCRTVVHRGMGTKTSLEIPSIRHSNKFCLNNAVVVQAARFPRMDVGATVVVIYIFASGGHVHLQHQCTHD